MLLSVLLLCAVLLPGCYRSVILGKVVDDRDEALPGVAVTVEGASFQDVTSSVGEYQVRFVPGKVRLHFAKTGYTSARVELTAKPLARVETNLVHLWQLPPNKGVYFFENGRYSPVESIQPDSFGGTFGTEKWTDTVAPHSRPQLVAYKLPSQGASLVRLQFVEVPAPPERASSDVPEAWIAEKALPLKETALDLPEGQLLELTYEGALEPGTYAIDWGALQGKDQLEPLIYFFTIEAASVASSPAERPEKPAPEEDRKPAKKSDASANSKKQASDSKKSEKDPRKPAPDSAKNKTEKPSEQPKEKPPQRVLQLPAIDAR